MDRLEEINKQIAELEAERKELVKDGVNNTQSELEKYYQDALKLKDKYIRWNDSVGTIRVAKVTDINNDNEIELVLEKLFTLFSDGTFCTYNNEYEMYTISHAGQVLFKGDQFSVINASEYVNIIYDAVYEFCLNE